MARLPLEGIRVLGMTVAWTGPWTEMLLGDLGAEVIKIESIQHWASGNTRGWSIRPTEEMVRNQIPMSGGYPNRKPGQRPWNQFPSFNFHGRNKLGMTVDIKKPEGLDIVKRLIKKSDVFIENNATGTLEKLGLDYEILRGLKPDIIVLRSPAFGLSGPYGNVRCHGAQLDQIIGHSLLRGYPDVDLSYSTNVYATDYFGGVLGAYAILLALYHRYRTGEGQMIELAQAEATLPALGQAIIDFVMNGRIQITAGNRDIRGAAPCGCYPCKGEDRWLNIRITSDAEWQALCQIIGNDLYRDPRFVDSLSRFKNQDELDMAIRTWTVKQNNIEAMNRLQAAGIPAGAVFNQRDAFDSPHFKERGFFEEVTQEDCGTHLYPGMLFNYSKTPLSIRKPPVRLGEHNEYVYRQVIGVSNAEYEELLAKGHIGMDVAPGVT